MRKITLSFLAVISAILLFAQTPQNFKYQAVARDNIGNILNNQLVSFRISILQGSSTGVSVYSETHQMMTTDFGLVNLNIGSGFIVSGNFTSIDWSSTSYFLKLEMDPAGGSGYQVLGTSQLLSVPYALYSENTANTDDADADPINELNTDLNLNGNSLEVTDAGGTLSVELGSLSGDDDWTIIGANMYYTGVTGNVGIGTTSPDSKLDVAGHIFISNTGGSVFLGRDAGLVDDLNYNYNVFVGQNSGKHNISGDENTACGAFSLEWNSTGNLNTALGYTSLVANTEGFQNTAVGALSLYNNSTGSDNSAFGYGALRNNQVGYHNTAIGDRALFNNVSGFKNTVIGFEAGYGNSSINNIGCVFIGYQAGFSEDTDSKLYIENSSSDTPLIYGDFTNDFLAVNGKLGIGTMSPNATLDVAGHISIGYTGHSVFLGYNAGLNDDLSANYNTFIGYHAGYQNSTGDYNNALGAYAMNYNTGGYENNAFGDYALNSNTTGNENSAFGYIALEENETGSGNTAIGNLSLRFNTSGSYNTALGFYAGYNTTYSGGVYIGYKAGYNNNSANKLYIENSDSDLPLIYGDFSSNILAVNGKLGIGTHLPGVKLQVVGGSDATLAGGGYIVNGFTSGQNIVIDENEIMARNNGAISSLHLQRNGGALNVHYEMVEIYEFAVAADGKTGIGENSPTSKLHINTKPGEDGLRIQVEGTTKLKVSSNGGISNYNPATPTFAFQLENSNVDLRGRGRAYSWNTYSDDRLKSNQRSIEYGLKEVMQLQPKSYFHHSSSTSENGDFVMVTDEKTPSIGFIAQEMHLVIPEAVSKPEDASKDLWSMDYDKLIPVLTKAIQEQQAMIESMQLEIEALKNQINNINRN